MTKNQTLYTIKINRPLNHRDVLVLDEVCLWAVRFYDHEKHDPLSQSNGFIYGSS